MQVLFNDKVKPFVTGKGKDAINVELKGCSSWGVGEPQPIVLLGKPRVKAEEYDVYPVDGIDVYVQKTINAKDDTLKINYTKILFKESLTVDGIVF